MFCKYCGKQIKDGSCFCTYCGKSLTTADVASDDTTITSAKSPNKARGIIIALIILTAVLSAVGVSVYHYNNTEDDDFIAKVEEHIDDDSDSHKSSHKSDSHSHDQGNQVDSEDSKPSINSRRVKDNHFCYCNINSYKCNKGL
ncbi:MAG: zinc-ribbon domain-containing protein [Clostridium sp.]|nr:zinc-ribbon domain-containing protein [Clostridium sp.]